jgi:hypothetical protein
MIAYGLTFKSNHVAFYPCIEHFVHGHIAYVPLNHFEYVNAFVATTTHHPLSSLQSCSP